MCVFSCVFKAIFKVRILDSQDSLSFVSLCVKDVKLTKAKKLPSASECKPDSYEALKCSV